MKTRHLLHFLPALAFTCAADTIEMKDGTTYEGSILKQEGDDYIVEVQVTKTIRDERRIPRADVARIVAERKDETEFEELAKLTPAPDLLTEGEYDARIDLVEKFLRKYPTSKRKAEANSILSELASEREAITKGGIKFDGKLIAAPERNPEAYALDARIAAAKTQRHGDAGEILLALRAWSALEKEFLGSSAYLETIPYAVKLMRSHLATVTNALNGFDARVRERESGLSRMAAADRTRSKEAIDDELASYQRRVDTERAAGIKWLSLDPYVKQPLEDTRRSLESEIRRLENLQETSLPKIEAAYTQAWAAVTKEGATQQEVDSAMSQARGTQVPQAYLDILAENAVLPPTNYR